MARAYGALGVPLDATRREQRKAKQKWNILSFRRVAADDAALRRELRSAQRATRGRLRGRIFRFEMYQHRNATRQPDFRKVHKQIRDARIVLVGAGSSVLIRKGAKWKARHV
jgi:hypothetical protein